MVHSSVVEATQESWKVPIAMILSVPYSILAKIASPLSICDVLRLQSTCRSLHVNAVSNFWAPKFDDLPEQIPRPTVGSSLKVWVSELVKWQRKALGISSSNIYGAWLNDPRYWAQNAPESKSPYGTAHVLKHVCWLDLGGILLCPPGSTYFVALRCKVTKSCKLLSFKRSCDQKASNHRATPIRALMQMMRRCQTVRLGA